MNAKIKIGLFIGLPLIGILTGYLLMGRQVTLTVDGETSQVTTHALTVRGALRSAGYTVTAEDKVTPSVSTWLSDAPSIVLHLSHPYQVWNDATGALIPVEVKVNTPIEMLIAAGIAPQEGDQVRLNGLVIPMDFPLADLTRVALQYTPAVNLSVIQNGQEVYLRSGASSLGQALWDNQIRLRGGDSLSQSFTSAPNSDSPVSISNAVPVTILADGQTLSTTVSAANVGEALAMAGITLQDLDYSKPAEGDPLPDDGRIEVVRVREEVLLEQQSLPYSTETVADDTLDLDQTKIVTTGEFGIQAARVRVRYENGVEVSRQNEDIVVLKQPVNQVQAYGTKVTYQTLDTPDGTITYYRAITVTATSYSPCNSGADTCYPTTAAGTTVKKGTLAVNLSWYKLLKGSTIYVPGYGVGTVLDTGSYPYNNNWIDLGYTDDEFESVTTKTFFGLTIYFLAPFPDTQPWVLP